MIRVKHSIATVLVAIVFLIAGCSQGKKKANASEHDKSEITAVAILLSASGDQRVDDPGLDAGAAVPDGLRGAE